MQKLTDNDLKKIITRRDPRYDGRFFFGVKTTRIYCRPICPARPKLENILIFRSHSEAEKLGYRPCLRCRPDAAPGSKVLDGTMNTVARGLRIIQDAASEEVNMTSLAGSLGVTDRHLRRLFDEHLGASPIEILTTQRLHFAKQMLQETAQPITQIAFASGFQSVRRFNEAFKARFRTSPSTFRSNRRAAADVIALKIMIRLPYDWNSVIAYLKRHETFGLERVEEGTYRRFLPRENSFGSIVISHQAKKDFLKVEFTDVPLHDIRPVLTRIKSLFDTEHNPVDLPRSRPLKPNGIRVPGSFDPFEVAVSIILSQLVSTENAKGCMRRLMERYGKKLGEYKHRPVYAFPSPSVLAHARVEDIGVTKTKAGAIRDLSKAILSRDIDFKAHTDFETTTEKLLAIKGIGPWTASMIAMRCLGNPDAFPELDLIVQRALERQLVDQTAWISSRAYLTHCLWRDFGKSLSKTKRGTK